MAIRLDPSTPRPQHVHQCEILQMMTCMCANIAVPYYRKLTLHEIKVLEINANLMENDFRIKQINAKEEVEFHNKGN